MKFMSLTERRLRIFGSDIVGCLLMFVMLLSLSGCNTTGAMRVPKSQISATAVAESEKNTTPLDDQATFALTKVIANIRRGTTIAHFPAYGADLSGYLCNYRHYGNSTLEWGSGSRFLGGWRDEFGEIFFDVLSSKGLNIAGDPKQLFENEKVVQAAEYSIGARIKEIKGNFCDVHDFWSGYSTDTYTGEMYVDVEWTVYANLQRRRVLTLETQGYYKLDEAKKDGIIVVFQEAFARATEKLAHSKKFTDLALRRQSDEDIKPNSAPVLTIAKTKLRKRKVDKDLEAVLSAVVTLRVGGGHGSGFLISADGLVLTNQHVVVGAKNVTVILNNGLEVVGTVLRTDKIRDVALVKIPVRIRAALPIRTKLARRLEKVYVVGTPADESLRSTVTSGIVSALRVDSKNGQTTIQSDASITGGNSGGPMLDEHGNVIGISVATISRTNDLNLFIPIGEALRRLNITIADENRVPTLGKSKIGSTN